MARKYDMSRREAERHLEEEVRSSYFWQDTRNKRLLQAIIDVLFNSIEGNDYSVDCAQTQYSERLKIVCHICKTDLSSYDPFMSHERGKSHKKILQQVLSPKDPNLVGKINRKDIKKEKGIFMPGSLEDDIDLSSYNIVGVPFVYKEAINGMEYFTCSLCKEVSYSHRVSKEEIYHHLIGTEHSTRYLEKKFGYSRLRHSEFKYQLEKVVTSEGKIHGEIVDFSKQLTEEELSKGILVKEEVGQSSGESSKKSIKYHPTESIVKTEALDRNVSEVSTVDSCVGCCGDDLKNIEDMVNYLKKEEALGIALADGDMQSLLIHFNWILTDRLAEYYEKHDKEFIYHKETRVNVEEKTQKRLNNSKKLAPYVYIAPNNDIKKF